MIDLPQENVYTAVGCLRHRPLTVLQEDALAWDRVEKSGVGCCLRSSLKERHRRRGEDEEQKEGASLDHLRPPATPCTEESIPRAHAE